MFELDCSFDRLEDREIRNLMGGIFALRKSGYLSHHQYGILPIDAYDWIATHYGIYIDGEHGPEVLTSYRTVEHARCKEFRLTFPLETILKNSNATFHLQALERFVAQSQFSGRPLIYSGSWTIDPKTKQEPEVYKAIYDMFFAMNILSHLEDSNPVKLACGSLRLKTVRPIRWMGYEYIQNEKSEELPHFQQSNLNDEDVMAMFMVGPSEEAIASAKKFEDAFKNRRRILRPEIDRKKAAA